MPFSPTDCVSATPGVRLRPVPEMGTCLAYDPSRARLHTLNATSWLLLSLCDGRTRSAIAAEFNDALRSLPGPAPEQGAFSRGLEQLAALGLVATATPTAHSAAHPPTQTGKEPPR